MFKRKVLFIDNDLILLRTIKAFITSTNQNYDLHFASSIEDAKNILSTHPIHLIVIDVRAKRDNDEKDKSGIEFARTVAPTIPKIILTNFPSYSDVISVLRQSNSGTQYAVEFLDKRDTKPSDLLDVIEAVFNQYVRVDYHQFKVGGALTDQDAVSYISRNAEIEIIHLLKKMEYILIIEPRQQGKTSLINFIMRHPELSDGIFVYVDTTSLNRESENKWYQNLVHRMLQQIKHVIPEISSLNAPTDSSEWRNFLFHLASSINETNNFFVVALDEIGTSFPSPNSFFSVLRDIYNSRQIEPQFRKIAFILLGCFHPRELVSDDQISPFNIAKRVRLTDFSQEGINFLTSKITSSDKESREIADRVYYWTGGQPYLSQKLCENLGVNPQNIDIAATNLLREDENHFLPLLKQLQKDKGLMSFLMRLSSGEKIVFFPHSDPIQGQLELFGLIKADEQGNCKIRNKLYEKLLLNIESRSHVHKVIDTRPVNYVKLSKLVARHFDTSELKALCFELEINYDDLNGANKQDKARELISYLERRNKIMELVAKFKALRPNSSIESIFTESE